MLFAVINRTTSCVLDVSATERPRCSNAQEGSSGGTRRRAGYQLNRIESVRLVGDTIRATQKCLLTTHSCPSCSLLPPRGIGRPFVKNEKAGGSGGGRTHIQSLGALRSKLTVCHSWASGLRGRVPSWSIHTPEFRVRIGCHDSSRFVRTLLRLWHVSVRV